MRLIFAGTPLFAAHALRAILLAGHEVALVLTQADKAAGRGMSLRPSPVKELAVASGIEVFQPLSLKDPVAQERLRATRADAMIVAAYGLILPQAVLDLPRLGCLNIHASLLPRWRGAAPIQRAILAGDAESGICLMQMEAGLDTGPVLCVEKLPIVGDETTATLHDKLAELGARLIVDALPRLPLPAQAQTEVGASYAHKIEKSEAALDWRQSAQELDRKIRAFNPFPGASTQLAGTTLKIWQARIESLDAAHKSLGSILSADKNGIVVACGVGTLRVTELQKAGGKRQSVASFFTGNPIQPGSCLALSPLVD